GRIGRVDTEAVLEDAVDVLAGETGVLHRVVGRGQRQPFRRRITAPRDLGVANPTDCDLTHCDIPPRIWLQRDVFGVVPSNADAQAGLNWGISVPSPMSSKVATTGIPICTSSGLHSRRLV